MTYRIYLDNGNAPLYSTTPTGRGDGDVRHRCPCGSLAFAQTMVDIRSFHLTFNGGQDFACSGCLSKWEREKRPLVPGDDFIIRHEHRAAFAAHRLGGPDPQAEAVALEYLGRELAKTNRNIVRWETASGETPPPQEMTDSKTKLEDKITQRRG